MGEFLPRTGKQDGLAVFFKADRLRLAERRDVLFRLTDDPDAVMNKDNVCLVCVLEDTLTQRKVALATTHLLYNPRRGEKKLGQLCMLMAELHRTVQAHDLCPLVLCGDFNLLPRSPLYSFITVRGSYQPPHVSA